MINEFPQELRADFQQFYSLNIEDVGRSFSVTHAAELTTMLPGNSRVMVAVEPALRWDIKDRLLARLINAVELLIWGLGGKSNQKKPKPIEPPKYKTQQEKSKFASMSADEFDTYVKQVRKGVTHDN